MVQSRRRKNGGQRHRPGEKRQPVLPVFAAATGSLLGPTGGYLVGFIGAAAVVSTLKGRGRASVLRMILACLALNGLAAFSSRGPAVANLGRTVMLRNHLCSKELRPNQPGRASPGAPPSAGACG